MQQLFACDERVRVCGIPSRHTGILAAVDAIHSPATRWPVRRPDIRRHPDPDAGNRRSRQGTPPTTYLPPSRLPATQPFACHPAVLRGELVRRQAAAPDTKEPGHDAQAVERIRRAPGNGLARDSGHQSGARDWSRILACFKGRVRCVAAGFLMEGPRGP